MKRNRIVCLLLALCMLCGLLAAPASAVPQKAAEPAAVGGAQTVSEEQTGNALREQASQLAQSMPERAGESGSVQVHEIDRPEDADGLLTQQGEQEKFPIDREQTVRAIVILKDAPLLEQNFSKKDIASATGAVAVALQRMQAQQDALAADVQQIVEDLDVENSTMEIHYHYTVAANGLAVELPYAALEQIEALDEVESVFVAPQYSLPEDMTKDGAEAQGLLSSLQFTGADKAWSAGFTGAGMRVAVIDTGLDLDHPSFAAAPAQPSLTKDELSGVVSTLRATERYGGLTADRLYRSEKVPYAFNYVDSTLDVTHDHDNQGDHGTHVAGIIAANRTAGTDVVGVAPDAQLLIMKVFGSNGGAYFDDILAALEDSFRLNADAVNMSLGTPAGFSSLSPEIDKIFARILDSDMIAAIAAGNSASAASMNGYGTDRNLTIDPDNGIVSSPATYIGATAVASVESDTIRYNYVILSDGEKVPYNDVAASALARLYYWSPEHTAEYVMIPGAGGSGDYEGIAPAATEDGSRKYAVSIAVVERGGIDFTSKQAFAELAGFDAIIVYDNIEGSMLNMADGGGIPNVFTTKEGGAKLRAAADENGRGVLTMTPQDDTLSIPSEDAGKMSDFSSWGVTPDLQLVPDITAPGGNIYSTLNNGHYGIMSGTSMATPQVAGMSAIVLQYLHKNAPDLTEAELHTVAEALLMSTATPVMESDDAAYSPRKQGAGAANVYDAINSPVYLTVQNGAELTPKVSFGDDAAKTGVYSFSFTMNNLSDRAQSYLLDASALTDQFTVINGLKFMSETSRPLGAAAKFSVADKALDTAYDYDGNGTVELADVQAFLDALNGLAEVNAAYDLNEDGALDTADAQLLYERITGGYEPQQTVTVPANGSVTVQVVLTLTDADKAYMDENYPNGIYVDGFVRCYASEKDGVDLSLPFLGYYGDWHSSRIIDDTAWYYIKNVIANRYVDVLFTSFGTSNFNLGLNPYITEDYAPEHNVLSPNGDGYQDEISEIYLGMMRNAKNVRFTWLDEAGNVLDVQDFPYARKSYYSAAYGLVPPLIYTELCKAYDFRNADGSYAVKDLDRVTLRIEASIDGETVDQTIDTPVIIDTEAPEIIPGTMDYFYSAETDARMLCFQVRDNYDIAAVVTMSTGNGTIEYIPVTEKVPGVDGETATILVDVSNYDADFRIAVCDYGANERYYDISFAGVNNYDADAFYGYRLFSAVPVGTNIALTEAYNGWHSFRDPAKMLMHTYAAASGESAVYAAEYVDGYVIGIDQNSAIFAMKAGDWTRTEIGKLQTTKTIVVDEDFSYDQTYVYPPLDMAMDYATGTLYVLTDESLMAGPGSGGHLLTLNWLTGEVTDLGAVTGLEGGAQALTLACDNEGVLYTVDSEKGDLYTIDPATAAVTRIGATGYAPKYQQSMAVDHSTDKLYWAGYQGFDGSSALMEIDKTTGVILSSQATEYNSEVAALYKPYEPERELVPADAELTGIRLLTASVALKPGQTSTLRCLPTPYYAKLDALTWSSEDDSIASVSAKGVVTAKKAGIVTVTASCGEFTAECRVRVVDPQGGLYVYDYGTDSSTSNSWLAFDASGPLRASSVPGATAYEAGITAAAYVGGTVYAFDGNGAFYQLDPATLTGRTVRIGDGQTLITAMAYNYADGYLYALSANGNSTDLCRVNLYTGATETLVQQLSSFYGQPLGGMAIDPNGRFYLLGISGGVTLTSFVLDDSGFPADAASTNLSGVSCTSYGSLLYSSNSDALYYAAADGNLYWLTAEVRKETKEDDWGSYDVFTLTAESVALDQIGRTLSNGTGMAMNMGLFEIPAHEPELPTQAITSATVPESVKLAVNGSKSIGLDVQPWNARYTAEFSVADPSVAAIDAYGLISGLSDGETTATAKVYDTAGALYATLTVPVEVVDMNVDLYAFLVADGATGGMKYARFPASRPEDLTVVSGWDLQMPYSAAYYNGRVYAIVPGGMDEGYKNRLMLLNPDSLQIQEILPEEVPYDVGDMTFDYTTGTLYGVVSGGVVTGGLAQFDPATGKTTLVHTYDVALRAITADEQGQLFVITADGELCSLDKTTYALTTIANVGGTDYFQSLHYDHVTHKAYRVTSYLSMLDLETGAKTDLGFVGNSYFQMCSLISMPGADAEPKVPETVAVNGVHIQDRAAMVQGETLALDATVLPVSVAKVDQTKQFASSDPSIATVDENGVVTAVSAGTVTITVTAAGYTDTCTVTVLEEAQQFYVYDETNRRWLQLDTKTGETTVKRDETGLSPIMAAADTGETIYAYDADGVFYSIDPQTFERTKLGDGLLGQTRNILVDGMTLEVDAQITDLSYDPDTQCLFGLLNGLYFKNGLYMIYSSIVEVNLEEGRLSPTTWTPMQVGDCIELYIENGENSPCYRPGNILVKNGYALSVDTWYSSILSRVKLTWNEWSGSFSTETREQLAHTTMYEWGMYYDSRSFVYDPVYDTNYIIYDLGVDDLGNGKVQGTLYTINIGNGSMQKVCELAEGMVVNSLLIR